MSRFVCEINESYHVCVACVPTNLSTAIETWLEKTGAWHSNGACWFRGARIVLGETVFYATSDVQAFVQRLHDKDANATVMRARFAAHVAASMVFPHLSDGSARYADKPIVDWTWAQSAELVQMQSASAELLVAIAVFERGRYDIERIIRGEPCAP
jgi:hypothetical protein